MHVRFFTFWHTFWHISSSTEKNTNGKIDWTGLAQFHLKINVILIQCNKANPSFELRVSSIIRGYQNKKWIYKHHTNCSVYVCYAILGIFCLRKQDTDYFYILRRIIHYSDIFKCSLPLSTGLLLL